MARNFWIPLEQISMHRSPWRWGSKWGIQVLEQVRVCFGSGPISVLISVAPVSPHKEAVEEPGLMEGEREESTHSSLGRTDLSYQNGNP